MFIKKERITKDIFSEVATKGFGFHGPAASIKVLKSQALFLFTVVVSHKVSKNASDRNLLKRRVRYIIKKHQKDLKLGFSFIFFLKPSSINLNFKQLELSILNLLTQANILNN